MNPALMVSPWLHYTYYQQKLTDYAKELAMVDDPNDPMTQRQLARDMDIRFDDLTDADIDYIAKEVERILC